MLSLELSDYNVEEYLFHSCNYKYNQFILWCRLILYSWTRTLLYEVIHKQEKNKFASQIGFPSKTGTKENR